MRLQCIAVLLLGVATGMCFGAEEPKVFVAPQPSQPPPTNAPTQATPVSSDTTPTPAPPPSASPKIAASELEKLAMPIALYPDPLLAVVLAASAYPLEIVQAARFVKDTNNIPKLADQSWDENVKSLAKFPDVIAKMDADLPWTIKLGQAFIDQPMDLMNAVQELRAKAQTAGNLKTTPQQVVTVTNSVVERTYQNQIVYVTNTVVQVQPASSQVVYVPSYNPSVVYVEKDSSDAAAAAVVSFGVGMAFGAAMWGNCDWHYGGCYWGHYPPPPPPMPPPYYPPPGAPPPPPARPAGTPPPGGQQGGNRPSGTQPPGNRPQGGNRPPAAGTAETKRWQPDQSRLSSAGAPSASTREARGWGGGTQSGGRTGPSVSTGMGNTRPSQGAVGTRPSTGAARPSTGDLGNRPSSQPAANIARQTPSASSRQASPSSFDRSSDRSGGSASGGSAFSGVSSGSASRSYSDRGASSRSGGGGGSRGGGGGRGGGGRGR